MLAGTKTGEALAAQPHGLDVPRSVFFGAMFDGRDPIVEIATIDDKLQLVSLSRLKLRVPKSATLYAGRPRPAFAC